MTRYKVVFHIDEIDKWKLVLSNCKNLLIALKDFDLTVEIVANSEAVRYLVKPIPNPDDEVILIHLAEEKVIISACNNALKSLEIEPKSLYPFVTVVPSGVAELTIKQHEGFAYIKP